jgi:hypothetical protein
VRFAALIPLVAALFSCAQASRPTPTPQSAESDRHFYHEEHKPPAKSSDEDIERKLEDAQEQLEWFNKRLAAPP